MTGTLLLLAALVTAGSGWCQSLHVYSEFHRIDPFGKPVDAGGRPREILSPAVARNAFASYYLAVTVPAGQYFHLHVGQNPEEAVAITVYRARYERRGEAWIADELTPVELPYTGRLPETGEPAGQTTLLFWMDLWVSASAPIGRIKVEPQLNVGERWLVYPMEVRIVPEVAPALKAASGTLPPVAAPADAAALVPLRQFLCGGPMADGPAGPPTVRSLVQRNARQDAALAALHARHKGREAVAAGILRRTGAPSIDAWCQAPEKPHPSGPEWYLRLRDFLYRGAADY